MFLRDPTTLRPLRRLGEISSSSTTPQRQRVQRHSGSARERVGLLAGIAFIQAPAYDRLVANLGVENVFILSAGWGLIRADFLTPNYDLTFSPKAEGMKRRRRGDRFQDLERLDTSSTDLIVFLGGKDYLPLFCSLTARSRAERSIYFNSSTPPHAPGCRVERYETSVRTNWHYECANRLVAGTLVPAIGVR
jgi:hypothetical protein